MSIPDEVKKVKKQCGFTQIDNGIFHAGLSCRAIGLLALMWSKPPRWRFSSDRLANEVSEGREAIRTAMRELISTGFVRRDQDRGDNGQLHTVFYLRDSLATPWPDDETPGQTEAQETDAGSTDAGNLGGIERTEKINTEVVSKTHAHPADEPVCSEEPSFDGGSTDYLFDDFWKLYPRRVGKRAAQTAWKSALNRARLRHPTEFQSRGDMILGALTARIAWWKQARTPTDKIPHAATWLNRDGWLDELEPTPAAAAASTAQAAADLAVRLRDEVDRAIHDGDAELAWRLTRSRARGRGDHWFDEIAQAVDTGRRDSITLHAVKRDGHPITIADIEQVRAAKAALWEACDRSVSPAIAQSSTPTPEGPP